MVHQGHMQAWVEGLRRGETESWRRLRAFVDGYVCRASAALDPHEREEIACDTLSAVWEILDRLRDSGKLLSVVRTIARRVGFRRVKLANRSSPLAPGLEDPLVQPTRAPEARELYDVLVGSLEDSDRRLFDLLYVDGSCGADLERRKGSDDGVLRKRKHRLHKRLRATLERYEAEDGWSGCIQDL